MKLNRIPMLIYLLALLISPANAQSEQQYDIDFTQLSHEEVASITFDMLVEPQKYVGKSVLISGTFYVDTHNGMRFFSVLIKDDDGCCPEGLSFIPSPKLKNPKHFPKPNNPITVIGTLTVTGSPQNPKIILQAEQILK